MLNFESNLMKHIDNFLINLYYGSVTEFIIEMQNKEADVPERYRPFLRGE